MSFCLIILEPLRKQVSELENKRHNEPPTICGFRAESTTGIEGYTQAQPRVTNQLLNGLDLRFAEHWKQCVSTRGVGHANRSKVQSFSHSTFLEQAFTRSDPRDSEASRTPSLASSYEFWRGRQAHHLSIGQHNQELWGHLQRTEQSPLGEGAVSSTRGSQEKFHREATSELIFRKNQLLALQSCGDDSMRWTDTWQLAHGTGHREGVQPIRVIIRLILLY